MPESAALAALPANCVTPLTALHQPGHAQRANNAAAGCIINKFSAQQTQERRHCLVHIAWTFSANHATPQRRLRGQLRQPLNVGKMQVSQQLRKPGLGVCMAWLCEVCRACASTAKGRRFTII